MKRFLSLCLVLIACDNTAPDVEFSESPGTAQAGQAGKADRAGFQPEAFLRKLRLGRGFQVQRAMESICGSDDLQHVEQYDGAHDGLGFDQSFVANSERSVAGLGALNRRGELELYCSGTLIARDLYLTASHCVDRDTVGDLVVFRHQLDPAGNLRRSARRRVTAVVEDGAAVGLDYAILRFEQIRFPRGFPLPQVAEISRRRPKVAAIIQHPAGQPKQVDAGEKLFHLPNWITYSDIDTRPGSSGSGVLDARGNVVGVHVQGGCDWRGANYAVPMDLIAAYSDLLATVACGVQTVTSAVQCGTTTITSAVECGTELVADAAECGTQVVTSVAECGTEQITSAVECGTQAVTSAAQCGYDTVTSAVECGTNFVQMFSWSALQDAIQDGIECVGSFFDPSSWGCNMPATCDVPASCQVPLTCDVPATCEIAIECEIALECEIPLTCEIPACD